MEIEDIYKSMTDLIDSAQVRGVDIVSNVEQMMTDLNNSEIPSEDTNKEKLENQINTTYYLLVSKNNVYTVQMLKYVVALQKYITDTYVSVDDFLSDNKIKVKSTFADISATIGYPISPSNISDVS